MKMNTVAKIALSITIFSGACAWAGSAEPEPDLTKLIDSLSAPDVADRDHAEGQIDQLPFDQLPALHKILDAGDLVPEAKLRLRRVVDANQRRLDVINRKRSARIAFYQWAAKQALMDYDKDKHSDPKWDDAAKKGISAAWLRNATLDPVERAALEQQAVDQLKIATDAGCRDPAVLVSAGAVSADTHQSPVKVFNYFSLANDNDSDTPICPYFATLIDQRLIDHYAAGYRGGITQKNFPQLLPLVNEMANASLILIKTPQVPLIGLVDVMNATMDTMQKCPVDAGQIFDHDFPPLEALAPNDYGVLCIKGRFYVNYAWKARGKGSADKVTPQGAKDFAERLEVANEALTRAWSIDPTDPIAPTAMIHVELGQGKGKDVMETWFKRAMDADADNIEACNRKQLYLLPKWYGSPEELIQFGKECLATGNFHTEIPMFAVIDHISVANLTADGIAYYKRPEVWTDLNSAFTGYLSRYPEDNSRRSYYALCACLADQWGIANEQFEKLGDNVDLARFHDNDAELQRYKTRARAMAKGGQ